MIEYKTRTLTPDQARDLLAKNNGNRPVRDQWVDQLAGLIKAGKWAETHQGIAIASTGRVLDGQHRLLAIVRAGLPVKILVATGLDEAVYRWIDGGKTRTHSDRLHLVDDAQINRICCGLVNNYLRYGAGSHAISVDDLENTFLEMADAFIYVGSAWSKTVKLITNMPIGAALVGYHHAHPDKAVEATEHLLTGRMLDDDHPILTLREALVGQRLRTQHDLYWKATAAFRAHHERRKLTALMAATQDFQGHTYDRLIWVRQSSAKKGIETKKAKGTPAAPAA